jgi:hypothetical protein
MRIASRFSRVLGLMLGVAAAIVVCLMLWGRSLLIASDAIPPHVDAAVVLEGSISAEKTRIAGAVSLLQRGIAHRILVSVPRESYWGQSLPPVARSYMERTYGGDVASKIDFCETGPEINSTEQEAQADLRCIKERGWHSIVIVTSDYHSRRAGKVWRRAIKKEDSGIQLWMNGVPDPDFREPWWRHRRSAKIWLSEFLKLLWTVPGLWQQFVLRHQGRVCQLQAARDV